MNDQWARFRDECPCRKQSHGSADLCCSVDDKGVMVAHHGDCVIENCSANWSKAINGKAKE